MTHFYQLPTNPGLPTNQYVTLYLLLTEFKKKNKEKQKQKQNKKTKKQKKQTKKHLQRFYIQHSYH